MHSRWITLGIAGALLLSGCAEGDDAVAPATNDAVEPFATTGATTPGGTDAARGKTAYRTDASVQAVDLENDIYILDVGSNNDVAPGDWFEVVLDDGEPIHVIVDKVFTNHASACRNAARYYHHTLSVPSDAVATIVGEVAAIEDDGERFVLSVGTTNGAAPDTEFTVHRDGAYVATVVVVDASPDSCVACIQDGMRRMPLRVGDRASAVR